MPMIEFDLNPEDRAMLARIEQKLDEMRSWFELLAPGLTAEQAAKELGMHEKSVRRLGNTKKLKSYLEGKKVMIPVSEVAREKERRHIKKR